MNIRDLVKENLHDKQNKTETAVLSKLEVDIIPLGREVLFKTPIGAAANVTLTFNKEQLKTLLDNNMKKTLIATNVFVSD